MVARSGVRMCPLPVVYTFRIYLCGLEIPIQTMNTCINFPLQSLVLKKISLSHMLLQTVYLFSDLLVLWHMLQLVFNFLIFKIKKI